MIGGLQLLGIINRLPLAEFRDLDHSNTKEKAKFEAKEKARLIQLANEAQKVMNSKNPESAVFLLDALILEIKTVTSKTFVAPNADALSQSDAISQIKSIIASLKASKDCDKGK